MNNKKCFFLDTATQIARHWHTSEVVDEIKKQLEDCKLYCSHYVKCQYKATFLNSAIYLHNLCIKSNSLLEAIQKTKEWRYSKEAGGKLTRDVLPRVVDIACWIEKRWKSFEDQIGIIRDLIEWAWDEFFEDGLETPLIDETGCVYAEGDPEMGESGTYKPIPVSCTQRKPPECRIQKFCDKHRLHLEALANMDIDAIKAEPKDTKELQNVKDHAQAIKRGELPHGERCRVHLSDAIICIESTHCPEPVDVHSINKKHFQPLGEVLGIKCEPKDTRAKSEIRKVV
jgi:hypothetical protein